MPLITVVLPVHNAADTITAAVSSILDQTFPDFELLIVDDGSTDSTSSQLGLIDDSRVRIISLPANLGIAHAINRGLDEATGELVARMDADDWSFPQRFQVQVDRFAADSSLDICGTFMITDTRHPVRWTMPCEDEDIRARLMFASAFYHPTVMLRRSILDHHQLRYDPNKVPAEDYALWSQLATVGNAAMANVPEVLVRYHLRPAERPDYARQQREITTEISQACATKYGFVTSEDERQWWLSLLGEPPDGCFEPRGLSAFCDKVLTVNDPAVTKVSRTALSRQILYRWHLLGRSSNAAMLLRRPRQFTVRPTRRTVAADPRNVQPLLVARTLSFLVGRIILRTKRSTLIRYVVGTLRQGRGIWVRLTRSLRLVAPNSKRLR
jgi:glycosyltransferase involved in cell wall biosynthesis